MKNSTTTTAKNATAKNENKVSTLNLGKFAEQLAKVELKEKIKKSTLYIYPDGYSESDINSEKGKKFRNKLRNEIKRLCNNILLFAKMNRIDDFKKEVEKFNLFYKTNYQLNDYSLASITNTKDEAKENDLKLMLSIIKDNMSK